jgi:hypothetical protein
MATEALHAWWRLGRKMVEALCYIVCGNLDLLPPRRVLPDCMSPGSPLAGQGVEANAEARLPTRVCWSTGAMRHTRDVSVNLGFLESDKSLP